MRRSSFRMRSSNSSGESIRSGMRCDCCKPVRLIETSIRKTTATPRSKKTPAKQGSESDRDSLQEDDNEYRRWDSNPHGIYSHWILNPVRQFPNRKQTKHIRKAVNAVDRKMDRIHSPMMRDCGGSSTSGRRCRKPSGGRFWTSPTSRKGESAERTENRGSQRPVNAIFHPDAMVDTSEIGRLFGGSSAIASISLSGGNVVVKAMAERRAGELLAGMERRQTENGGTRCHPVVI